jgi:anti-sigma regulatory factor (Ser/Thr protein kinase)
MPLYRTSCSSGPTAGQREERSPTESDSIHVLRQLASSSGTALGHSLDAVCPLRAHTAAPRTARDFTVATLRTWGLPALCDDAEIIVSELVTNAIRHGRPLDGPAEPPVRLTLARHDGLLVCIVADARAGEPAMRESDDACENGRGLHVVEALSRVWGWTPLPGVGKAVWAALTIP